ncbi:MAG: diguanylate cyclase, partial [Gammaproteobacteria bacterium]|nr:diguanylate cyclase [Gammaproteobacteria bacterium]
MNFQRKLIFYFIAPIICILLIFGYMAYQFTITVNHKHELSELEQSFKHHIHIMSNVYKTEKDHKALIDKAITLTGESYYLEILGYRSEVLQYITQSDEMNTQVSAWMPIVEKLNITAEQQGQLEVDGKIYYWRFAVIPDSPFKLLELYADQQNASVASDLMARMLTVGIVVLWIAMWIGIIISTALSKKFKAQTDALQYQATHDTLTQLPNRLSLQLELQKKIDKAIASDKLLSLIVMDLDRFKDINDTLGHDIGDQLLFQISQRLSMPLTERDTLARMGGDEFAIVLEDTDDEEINSVVKGVVNALQLPFNVKDLLLEVETSLGVAVCPRDGKDVRTLIRHAETAMYIAKHNNQTHAFYDEKKDPYSVKRLTLMVDLRRAIEDEELRLVYQPKVQIGKNRICGVEALSRWQHPVYGNIEPAVFISLAEQTGIIKPLTYWSLETGIKQSMEWFEKGLYLPVAVNLSPRMLHDMKLPENIMTLLSSSGLPANYLELEITESAIMQEPERA